jgi:transcriptional regulator with XRE-family HTH domain
MISLITVSKAQRMIADNMRLLRLEKGLTQAGLADRAGVSLPSLRKFEQKGSISFESLLRLSMVLGRIEDIVNVTKPSEGNFSSIDDVLDNKQTKTPQRGWRK